MFPPFAVTQRAPRSGYSESPRAAPLADERAAACWLGLFFDHPKPEPALSHNSRVLGAVAGPTGARFFLPLFTVTQRAPRAAATQQAPTLLRWPTSGPGWLVYTLGSFFDHPKHGCGRTSGVLTA